MEFLSEVLFVCDSRRSPSQWKTTRTHENPESPCCLAAAFTVIPLPPSPSPPLPTRQTTRCSGGRACSGHGGWAERGAGVPARARGVRAARQRGSVSRDWPCSAAPRGKNSTPWCERGWNTWVYLQLDSVSLWKLVTSITSSLVIEFKFIYLSTKFEGFVQFYFLRVCKKNFANNKKIFISLRCRCLRNSQAEKTQRKHSHGHVGHACLGTVWLSRVTVWKTP